MFLAMQNSPLALGHFLDGSRALQNSISDGKCFNLTRAKHLQCAASDILASSFTTPVEDALSNHIFKFDMQNSVLAHYA
jgi:hypothetical protein